MQKYVAPWYYMQPEPPPGRQSCDEEVYFASDVDHELSQMASAVESKGMEVIGLEKKIAGLESHNRELDAEMVVQAKRIQDLEKVLKQERHRSFVDGRICYRGFSYGVRSQLGIDSLRSAIEQNGHG